MSEVTQEDREAAAKVAVLVEMRELILAGKADHHAEPWASHRIAADRIEAIEAEIERLREALRNIRALATKRQNVCGPDGCLTDIECFASAALGSAKP